MKPLWDYSEEEKRMFGVDIVPGDQWDFENCDTESIQERDFTDVVSWFPLMIQPKLSQLSVHDVALFA